MRKYDRFREDLNRLVSSYYGKGRFRDTRNGLVYTSGCLYVTDSSKVQFLAEKTKNFANLSFEELRFLEPLE